MNTTFKKIVLLKMLTELGLLCRYSFDEQSKQSTSNMSFSIKAYLHGIKYFNLQCY